MALDHGRRAPKPVVPQSEVWSKDLLPRAPLPLSNIEEVGLVDPIKPSHNNPLYSWDGLTYPYHPNRDGGLRIIFDNPIRGVTPGQYAVLYDADICLGSGKILRTS